MSSADLPAPHHARLFHWLRWRMLSNSWRVFRSQSSLRPLTILLCSLIVWVFVFGISFAGFRFLQVIARVPLTGGILSRLFDVLFFALGLFLVFSTSLILYGSLFSSAECNFLLSKPVAADQVFAYKYQTAVTFSSWAFLLLGSPLLLAFGIVAHAPWHFYLFLPLFFLGFVLLPSSLGALACLLIVNLVPRRLPAWWPRLLMVVVVVMGLWLWQIVASTRPGSWGREEVSRLLGRFTFASSALIPSHWVAQGLHASGVGQTSEALGYLALVWSNGLFFYLTATWSARHLYRRGYNRLSTGPERSHKPGGHGLDRVFGAFLPFVQRSTRLLLVKDFRTFRRDPRQWSQVVLFSALMLLYILNVRRMFLGNIPRAYQNSISVLNLFAIALLLCTYTGRFVYPLLSLEGRKFWILGLLPLRREQLLWGKFAFSLTGTLLPAELLVILSDSMLGMPWTIILLHSLAVLMLAAGLSGLSVGLGAVLPNFRETDPSKIAVGFGGTLNLVVGLFYLLLILFLMVAPWHLQLAWAEAERGAQHASGASFFTSPWLVWLGAGLGLAVGVAVVFASLRAGVLALRSTEF